ncbi:MULTISPECIES: hypothetical protein [unclassified Pseudomonas]|uniref:hypothetical protein n=1 Tax=unclassified Pseudomonas TaxID=196821 RepID=UPI0024474E68|nr:MULTISPECIES: hypothetical protein [unclassified Pseudomonas]MDG9926140.1 hypothetical protein [Pseudomonas sp. GD04045]MDH0037484.1 hypothetical protein [Pseudomonas sp. GD04019]
MQTTQHARCQVLLHPACTNNPDAVRAVQQATGRLVVINGGKPQLQKPGATFFFVSGRQEYLSADLDCRRYFIVDELTGPFGGDAA